VRGWCFGVSDDDEACSDGGENPIRNDKPRPDSERCLIFRPAAKRLLACMVIGAPELLKALPTQPGELVGEAVDVKQSEAPHLPC